MDNVTALEQRNKAHNDINRADRARQVMEDPIVIEALTAMKGDLYNKFCSTEFKESSERDEIWRKMQTVNKFEKYFKEVMTSGTIGQHTLTMMDKAKQLIGL
jgi:hypothetical protein